MNSEQSEISWSEMIVMFNSLIRSIEHLREVINSDSLDDDDLYEAEEELNDYVTLIARLRQRYTGIVDKGELSETLSNKLQNIC